MPLIQFVENYKDLPTDRGFQFKFFCDKCQNGYMSRFDTSLIGTAGGLLRAAGDVFGGIFGQAGNSAYEIQRAVGGKAHDDALEAAVAEVKPHFHQCNRCGKWACTSVCWNPKRGLCTMCAPKLEGEIAAAQSDAQIEQIRERARSTDQTRGLDLSTDMVARCPQCQAETAGSKFCPECGHALAPKAHCGQCGATMGPNVKFCPDCGARRA